MVSGSYPSTEEHPNLISALARLDMALTWRNQVLSRIEDQAGSPIARLPGQFSPK